jgi:ABC-type transporter Mla subunit MlaD
MRWRTFSLAALAGIIVLAVVFVVLKPFGPKVVVKAYFNIAEGLRAGAPVGFQGVNVGSVKTVRLRSEMKETPVEVVMVLNRNVRNIPTDATARLETEGVLGPTYVDIDATGASGPPVGTNSVLKAQRVTYATTGQIQILEKAIDTLKKACEDAFKEGHADCAALAPEIPPRKNPSH